MNLSENYASVQKYLLSASMYAYVRDNMVNKIDMFPPLVELTFRGKK